MEPEQQQEVQANDAQKHTRQTSTNFVDLSLKANQGGGSMTAEQMAYTLSNVDETLVEEGTTFENKDLPPLPKHPIDSLEKLPSTSYCRHINCVTILFFFLDLVELGLIGCGVYMYNLGEKAEGLTLMITFGILFIVTLAVQIYLYMNDKDISNVKNLRSKVQGMIGQLNSPTVSAHQQSPVVSTSQ